MSNALKSIKVTLDKITNYNDVVDGLHTVFDEDINEIINALLFKNSIMSFDSTNENDKLLNRIIYLIGTSYYGWFEDFGNVSNHYDKICLEKNNEPDKLFSYEDIKRIMENDYKQNYGACYKTGYLNILMYINLVIRILEDKLNNINEYMVKLDDESCNLTKEYNNINKLLSNIKINSTEYDEIMLQKDKIDRNTKIYNIIRENTEYDSNIFNNILNNLIEFRYKIILELIGKLGIDENKKNKLIILLNKANELRLTSEDRKILSSQLNNEQINDIINSMCLFQYVKIENKQLQKRYVV